MIESLLIEKKTKLSNITAKNLPTTGANDNSENSPKKDTFVPEEGNKNRNFSVKKAASNFFLSGMTGLIKQVINNPAETLLVTGGIVLACAYLPAIIPYLTYLGIAYGIGEIGKGAIKAVDSYNKNDSSGLEESFKDLGSGFFNLLTTSKFNKAFQKSLKYLGKLTKLINKETLQWFSKVYIPKLKKLEPAAVVFGAFSFAEGLHIGHSILSLDAQSTLIGMGLFVIAKYIYVGFHHKNEVKQGIDMLKRINTAMKKSPKLRENIIQLIKSSLKSATRKISYQGSRLYLLGNNILNYIFPSNQQTQKNIKSNFLNTTQEKQLIVVNA